MKRPFRSRSQGPHEVPPDRYEGYDGYDEGYDAGYTGYDGYSGYDDGLDPAGLAAGEVGGRSLLGAGPLETGQHPVVDHDDDYETYGAYDDSGYEEIPVSGPGLIGRRLRRGPQLDDDGPAPTGQTPVVGAEGHVGWYETEGFQEQRSAWAYLGLLGLMFLGLSLFGFACTEDGVSQAVVPVDVEQGVIPNGAVALTYDINGDTVTVSGNVPDEAARTQIIEAVTATYGEGNVVDQLRVDSQVSFDEGVVRVTGTAKIGDSRPQALLDSAAEKFGLSGEGLEVEFVDEVLAAVDATVTVDGGTVAITGVVPDDQSVTDLTALVTETFGGTVDSAGLSVGAATWTDGTIHVAGSVSGADPRVAAFAAAVPDRLGALITVDTAGLAVADDPNAVAAVQTQVSELVTANPLQFAPDSAEMDAASDAIVSQVAELLNQVPSAAVSVVGHTDAVGEAADNQTLSEERAAAVTARLVELGVAEGRLTSSGQGEDNPIDDNDTDAGRAQNRRIEFILTAAG